MNLQWMNDFFHCSIGKLLRCIILHCNMNRQWIRSKWDLDPSIWIYGDWYLMLRHHLYSFSLPFFSGNCTFWIAPPSEFTASGTPTWIFGCWHLMLISSASTVFIFLSFFLKNSFMNVEKKFTPTCNFWQDDSKFFSEEGLPRLPFPHGWKGGSGLYVAGLGRRGILGASNDAQRIAADIAAKFSTDISSWRMVVPSQQQQKH